MQRMAWWTSKFVVHVENSLPEVEFCESNPASHPSRQWYLDMDVSGFHWTTQSPEAESLMVEGLVNSVCACVAQVHAATPVSSCVSWTGPDWTYTR